LIIRAIELIKKQTAQIETNKALDPNFIVTTVDFFRTYADRFHHGKEEGLLFKALSQRQLSEPDHKMMNELIMEHAFARRTITSLQESKENYLLGKNEALKDVLEALNKLIKLYPQHIEKENKQFFYPSMTYFSEQEQKDMYTNFIDFNQNFTDKRYKQIINSLEAP
jgi:hemerythrin-like domain-containing protein